MLQHAGDRTAVLHMHVAVDQIARLIALKQRQERLKAAMGKILRVAEAAGRGVTYREDLPSVKEAICALKAAGVYEERLWPDAD